MAGAGASSTITNAVSGSTLREDRSICHRRPTPGPAATLRRRGRLGGLATSNLTFDDTANTDESSSVIGAACANGGAGGVGRSGSNGGAGGRATSLASIIGAQTVKACDTGRRWRRRRRGRQGQWSRRRRGRGERDRQQHRSLQRGNRARAGGGQRRRRRQQRRQRPYGRRGKHRQRCRQGDWRRSGQRHSNGDPERRRRRRPQRGQWRRRCGVDRPQWRLGLKPGRHADAEISSPMAGPADRAPAERRPAMAPPRPI